MIFWCINLIVYWHFAGIDTQICRIEKRWNWISILMPRKMRRRAFCNTTRASLTYIILRCAQHNLPFSYQVEFRFSIQHQDIQKTTSPNTHTYLNTYTRSPNVAAKKILSTVALTVCLFVALCRLLLECAQRLHFRAFSWQAFAFLATGQRH